MKRVIQSVELAVLEMNQVAAKIFVRVNASGAKLRVECFEVGVDGSKPDWPLAVADEKFQLRIGTPFLWTTETQPRYAVVVSAEQDKTMESGEIQFGFDAAGKIVVTGPLRNISPPALKPNPNLQSLFVVGDSTAFSNGPNQRGWGDELANFFDSNKINVLNRARPGRSTRSYRSEGLWTRVLAELKSDDVVLIQFGHNDADKIGEGRCRGVLPGLGGETQTVTMPDGAMETVHTYGWYLRQYVAEIKARGATPILLSLTAKNLWLDGIFVRHQSEYGEWAGAVAGQSGAIFLDLTAMIAERYEHIGRELVQSLFCSLQDNVHTSPAGAKLNAELVARSFSQLAVSIFKSSSAFSAT